MSKITVREYLPGDSVKIYSLFNEYTPYERDSKFWVWINRLLSDKASIIVVAEHENTIIGHYAVIPKQVTIDEVSYDAAFAIHAFIHPDFRNGLLIMQITKKTYDLAKDHGIDFIYGFPNESFREIQIKADKWKSVSLFNALEKGNLTNTSSAYTLVPINDTFEDIYTLSEILDTEEIKSSIYITKSLNYYINRYLRHPQQIYQNFFITKDSKVVAFICLKIFDNGEMKVGHLVDYIIGNDVLFEEILDTVESYFHNKVSKISVWKFTPENKKTLLENQYLENGFQTFLGVKMLTKDNQLEEKLINFNNWNLCMGDSDAF